MMSDTDLEVRDGVDRETIETVNAMSGSYKYGWSTDIEMDYAPKGVSEEIVRLISGKNNEPEWMLEWRLAAYRRWVQMEEPRWAMLHYPEIDYQDQYYYAKPKSMAVKPKSLDEVDPKLLATYAKLGIPLKEQMLLAGVEAPEGERRVAVDAVFDSVSLGTTFKAELAKAGVIFCSISEALREHPELVKKYIGSVVPQSDNFFATLNSAVFSDGSFVYIPPAAGARRRRVAPSPFPAFWAGLFSFSFFSPPPRGARRLWVLSPFPQNSGENPGWLAPPMGPRTP